MRRTALFVPLLVLGACANHALDAGSAGNGADAAAGAGGSPSTGGASGSPSTGGAGGSPSTGGASGSPSTGGAGGSPSTGGASGSPSTGGSTGVALACAATCDTPAGPSTRLSSNGALVGRWEICSGNADWTKVGAPLDTIGVEYTADGHMYYLIAGAAGPVRGVGFAYQLTYDVLPTGQLNMHPAPNAGFFGSVSVSPCPRELQIAPFAYDTAGTMLVPFEYSPDATPPPVSGDPTCPATCETPAGTVASSQTVAQAYAALEGRWLICGDMQAWWSDGAPKDVVGVEFGVGSSVPVIAGTANGGTVGGKMYYLVHGSAGLERGVGFAYQLTYDLLAVGSYFQLDMHPAPNVGFGTTFRYSPCPREIELPHMAGPASSILIPPP